MSLIIHKAVIVTTRDWDDPQYNNDLGPQIKMPDIEGFRAELPEEVRHLLVGPVPGLVNGFLTYFWAPSGSKIGRTADLLATEWCERFLVLWGDSTLWGNIEPPGDCPHDVVVIKYGADYASEGIRATTQEPYGWWNTERHEEQALNAAVTALRAYLGPDMPWESVRALVGRLKAGEDVLKDEPQQVALALCVVPECGHPEYLHDADHCIACHRRGNDGGKGQCKHWFFEPKSLD